MSDINLTPEELEAMLDRAARRGAKEALSAIGLHDTNAGQDIYEMRNLLVSWRETKKSVWSTFIKITTIAILSFIATAVYMQLGKQ
jgi:2-iminoacetate synthase ThiH